MATSRARFDGSPPPCPCRARGPARFVAIAILPRDESSGRAPGYPASEVEIAGGRLRNDVAPGGFRLRLKERAVGAVWRPEVAGQAQGEGARRHRLFQELADTGALQLLRVNRAGIAAHEDDRQVWPEFVQRHGELGAGHLRHDL